LHLILDVKSPIAATVLGSMTISEDASDRCRVCNQIDSKGNSRGIVSVPAGSAWIPGFPQPRLITIA
jgi:hypothetical protein